MKLEQLQQIIEIDKQKSISKAAESLYIARSTLSGSLTGLEDEVGVRLFERTASGVEPTPEGKEALQLAKVMVEAAERMMRLGQAEKELHGIVTLNIGQAYGFLLKELLLRFRHRYPKAELKLNIRTTGQLMHDVTAGNVNLTLALLPKVLQEKLKLKENGLRSETFGTCNFQIYVGRNSKFAERKVISMEELYGEMFVVNCNEFWEPLQLWPKYDKVMVIPDRDMQRQLVCDGERVALLPALFSIGDVYCETGMIKTLELEPPISMPLEVMLIYPEKRTLTLLEQNVVILMRELLQEYFSGKSSSLN